MRQWNSNGKDPWPENADLIFDNFLMSFLASKIKSFVLQNENLE